ncbi:MAG: CcmD family protein [Melioribacteraceae bacterium]|nr:CcmD family protein [Melioribacteraceae bacterium]MCF8263118.1 CcmD family protein [Melioribacteraceae bacterium]MCF8413833.1 CcmD family protein [Melioribacteraceae bacterium]MCF8430550.1 CcmD family protein [Melioribacteraceae bacterium]
MESFLEQNSIYIVLFIVLTVWTGIFVYLLNLDKSLKKIEEELGDSLNEK